MTIKRWAQLSGWLGVLANVLLLVFYGLAQPWQRGPRPFEWVGTVNDVIVAAQFATLIPFARLWRPGRGSTSLAIVSLVAVVVLQVALVFRILSFAIEGVLVTLFLLAVLLWVAASSSSPIGRGIGVSLPLAVAIVALSFLLPSGSPAHYAALGVGAAVGIVAWIAFPIWLLAGGWRETGFEATL